MSTAPRRRPSTLAADKFRAAQQPLGASVIATRSLPAGGSAMRPVIPPEPTAKAPAAPTRPVATASAAREQRDTVFVSSVVVAFVMLTLAVAGVKVSGSMKQDRSRSAISGTLTRVYEQQSAFRILNQRFATWPELEARGMSMPPQHRVVASNASRSHWFMAVRDTNTGVVCSRTGELFDDSPLDRQPSCSSGGP